MIKHINYSDYVKHGIKHLTRGFPMEQNMRIFGADTETCQGMPITLQISDGADIFFEYVDGDNIFRKFTDFVFPRCRPKGFNVCYFHNLKFDLPILFFKNQAEIYEQNTNIEFEVGKYKVKMLFGKVCYASIADGALKLHIFDSYAFTQNSLKNSLKQFGIEGAKMEYKQEWAENISYSKEFQDYAINDAKCQYLLARKIIDIHKEYDVKPCISLPQFASRVFRGRFMGEGERIMFPNDDICRASELSYHGGKNGCYIDRPRAYEDLYEIDINSAYPFAMWELPNVSEGYYMETTKYHPNKLGLYKVSGNQKCKYPIVYTADFQPIRGEYQNEWITGYELDCVKKSGDDYKIEAGYVWKAEGKGYSAFRKYVEHFYKLKQQTPKSDPNYYLYKILLNALYGKLIQTQEDRTIRIVKEQDAKQGRKEKAVIEAELYKKTGVRLSIDFVFDKVIGDFVKTEKKWVAGGMYNPFIATQITGRVRSMLWELERKYKAVHSATDSVKTAVKPKTDGELGGSKLETFGRCYIFRNKLYLHCCKDNSICGHKDPPFKYPKDYHIKKLRGAPLVDKDGQHLCKVGMHGFKGDIYQLWDARHELIKTGRLTYTYRHIVGLREGFKQGLTICNMITKKETLTLF